MHLYSCYQTVRLTSAAIIVHQAADVAIRELSALHSGVGARSRTHVTRQLVNLTVWPQLSALVIRFCLGQHANSNSGVESQRWRLSDARDFQAWIMREQITRRWTLLNGTRCMSHCMYCVCTCIQLTLPEVWLIRADRSSYGCALTTDSMIQVLIICELSPAVRLSWDRQRANDVMVSFIG
jgi:hypothetical protein